MQFYNHTTNLLATDQVDFNNLKVMLFGAGYSFNPAETSMSAVAAQQVSGNGWPAGGPTIDDTSITTVNTNVAMLDGEDIEEIATGGAIGPAAGMVVYDSTGANAAAWKPLTVQVFSSPLTAPDGLPFQVQWAAGGILRWVV